MSDVFTIKEGEPNLLQNFLFSESTYLDNTFTLRFCFYLFGFDNQTLQTHYYNRSSPPRIPVNLYDDDVVDIVCKYVYSITV